MRRRSGFTLIELLVVIAIIGVLVALLLPAIQQAREAARRAQCSGQLKQIGLAIVNYHDQYGFYPYASNHGVAGVNMADWWGWTVRILPYMEESQAFDAANMTMRPDSTTPATLNLINTTVTYRGFASLQCPSDPQPPRVNGQAWGATSYRACHGTAIPANIGSHHALSATGAPYGTGVFESYNHGWAGSKFVRLADISDGTSKTAMVSESVKGNGPSAALGSKSVWFNGDDGGGWWNGYAGAQNCLNSTTHTNWDYSGYQYFWGGLGATGYVHALTPNTRNCTYPEGGTNSREWNSACASSYHTGGVNMCFADGTVRFIGDSINLNTYRALASRNMGETISEF